jgi:protein-L-isoaspartate(D-aspartate) O-methyltransferase
VKTTRDDMLKDIVAETRFTRSLTGRHQLDQRVMQAIADVPREHFVPPDLQDYAYANGPLPIGHGQTISQPFIVALMTDLLQLEANFTVLEVGTGCGYQTAVLASLVSQVYTIELVAELLAGAQRRLADLHIENIHFRQGNGHDGWPEYAPYDAIVVTAAARRVPPALLDQLKPGGRMVIPVGEPYGAQSLRVVEKDTAAGTVSRDVLGVAFVPLVEA